MNNFNRNRNYNPNRNYHKNLRSISILKEFIKNHKILSALIVSPIFVIMFIFIILIIGIYNNSKYSKSIKTIPISPISTPVPTLTNEQQYEKGEENKKVEHEKKIDVQFSWWDGSHDNLTKYIKESMNDPNSFEHVETKYIDYGDYITVWETFRGKNAFGGVVKNTVVANVSLEGKIIEILDQY